MNELDVGILILAAILAMVGYAQGFIVGAASLIGLALGGMVGTRVGHALIEQASTNADAQTWAPLVGLVLGLVITLIGALAMQDLGNQIRVRVHMRGPAALDHLGGAVLLASMGAVLIWFGAAAAIGVPQLRSMRPDILESKLVQQLNAVLPPAGPLLGAIAAYDPFPTFEGGRIVADAPDPQLPRDPEVRAVSARVLRVVGTACGYGVTGSGWVIAPGYVVTNAHVVAGEEDTAVQREGRGELIGADVVHFDFVNDIAILRVHGLDLPPIPIRDDVPQGTAAVVLGYPENRGFTATPARVDKERDVRGDDIYGNGPQERVVTAFRGVVRHGNSGGPVVDGDGRVVATVFAATVGTKVAGGYGVPDEIVTSALSQAQGVAEGYRVRTGACVA